MKNTNRRYFLRNASLSATGVLLMSRTGARKSARRTSTISCAPQTNFALTGSVSSVKSGKWSDAATWGGKVPGTSDTPLIQSGHTIVFDVPTATVAGVNVNSGGILQFDNLTSCTLQSTQNVVVQGTLQMRPNTPTVIQTLRFSGVDESKFAGGGMDVLATDIGLWVMGVGKLDVVGSTKTSWLRSGGAIAKGATNVAMETAPTGWMDGDEISVTPTGAPGTTDFSSYSSSTIKSVSGSLVSINGSFANNHPKVNNLWTAEVMNLTRNVRIEGTSNGYSHIFIRSSSVQSIKFAALRYMGPRKDRSGDGVKELVAGRYGVHFHHCEEGSRGSQIEGNVIRDSGNHCYVPHVSHGVKFLDNIAYDVTEIAFWFDPGDPTHDAIFDHNIAANIKFVARSLDMNSEDAPTFASSGFSLNSGDGNICRNNVVVGSMGDAPTGGGYNWEAVINDGVWGFTNNMSHNCHCGLRIWQNTTLNHTIESFTGYYNGVGIFHGAYANRYNYNGIVLYGCGLQIKAASTDSNCVRFENMTIDGAGLVDYCVRVIESPLDGAVPLFLRNMTLKGATKAAISNESPEFLKCIDVIGCNITGTPYYMQNGVSAKEVIRVQPTSGQPFAIVGKNITGVVNSVVSIVGGVVSQLVPEWNGRKTDIAAFAPSLWGNGKGLKSEYFNGSNFNNPAFTRIDPNISFYEWDNGVHHLITSLSYSIRWTGQIQPQFTEAYNFYVGAGGGYKVWINNQLVMNSWQENYPSSFKSGAINLVAGQKYDLKIEFNNNDNRSGMSLSWESKSLPREYVPQSQLYTDAVSSPPPGNIAPIANAGSDITIQLPTSSTTLNGSASSDTDGSIVKYAWTKIGGPTAGLIVSPISSTSQLTQLVEGTYTFRLQVTDDKGLTGEDQITVIVKPDVATPANKPPVANAGTDITIQLPVDYTTLKGTGSDPEGAGVSFKWALAGGTATAHTLLNASAAQTDVTGLVTGAYVFRLTVTDNKGLTASDDVTVTVKAASTNPPPANKPPVAIAGNDITITLPTNSCTLNGSGTDSDGTIKSYKWTLIGGTATQYLLSNSTSAITALSNLAKGNYIFRLTVTDNSGATASDDITVTVNDAPAGGPNDPPILLKPLVVIAAPNPTTSVWQLYITSSSALPIKVRIYDSRGNLVTTINNVSNSATLTVGAFLRRGTYVAVVEQGTQKKLITLVKY